MIAIVFPASMLTGYSWLKKHLQVASGVASKCRALVLFLGVMAVDPISSIVLFELW